MAVVLGSGLGIVPQHFDEIAATPFSQIPGLVAPSVHGHAGTMCLGVCSSRPVLILRGRLHYYEGQTWKRVAGPMRILTDLGIRIVLLTNAAGGIHDELEPGDLMVLNGHLFLQKPNAWQQPVNRTPYTPRLIELLCAIESQRKRRLRAGVYAAVTGPCYETPAEIRALRAMGADAVGMSTAFEAETAAELGMEVAALSCITNKGAGLAAGVLDHADVLANATRPAERLSDLVAAFLNRS